MQDENKPEAHNAVILLMARREPYQQRKVYNMVRHEARLAMIVNALLMSLPCPAYLPPVSVGNVWVE
ncbi:hypothetical protein RRG08_048026 [Elysia crispata]|uniref:Uncharacterized protein n=1 Tax=Elysia crispata TaxID=231223 RepID=A0AAE1CKY2_9GAST|nr:hypothetical protein RRG08_048026 [Elysia crispata]